MQLKTFIDIDEFNKEVMTRLDGDNIMEAMSTQTARAAFYSMQVAAAKRQKEEVAHTLKLIAAQLTTALRKKLKDEADAEAAANQTRPEKVTVDQVQAAVALHPEMRKWERLQIEADEIHAVCRAAYDAYYNRREMLTGIGHMKRAEMQTNLTIRSHNDKNKYRERRLGREAEAAGQGGEQG